MSNKNGTGVSGFIFLGLSSDPTTQKALFGIFLVMYLIIVTGNGLIIIVTTIENSLNTPMYFFLTNLSLIDLLVASTSIPRMLKDLLAATKIISFAECAVQMYISLSLGIVECFLLAIMAYDRYIAICHPLHYMTIINKAVCINIAATIWISGFLLSISHVVLTMNVDRCGHNKINHFLCEVPEILSLQCENIVIVEVVIYVVALLVLIIPVTFIMISYIKIIITILKISSAAGQQKAFSTCGSHMMVVTFYYGSAMASYMKPKSSSSPVNGKMNTVLYFIVTPMLNPLIYTLRNNEVKAALKKIKIRYYFSKSLV
ncbi:putative olfactory receptor 2B8 [Discoglossus pictus]